MYDPFTYTVHVNICMYIVQYMHTTTYMDTYMDMDMTGHGYEHGHGHGHTDMDIDIDMTTIIKIICSSLQN